MPDIQEVGKTMLGFTKESDYVRFVGIGLSGLIIFAATCIFLAKLHLNDDKEFKTDARKKDSIHLAKEKYLETENARLHEKLEDILINGRFRYEKLKQKTDSLTINRKP